MKKIIKLNHFSKSINLANDTVFDGIARSGKITFKNKKLIRN